MERRHCYGKPNPIWGKYKRTVSREERLSADRRFDDLLRATKNETLKKTDEGSSNSLSSSKSTPLDAQIDSASMTSTLCAQSSHDLSLLSLNDISQLSSSDEENDVVNHSIFSSRLYTAPVIRSPGSKISNITYIVSKKDTEIEKQDSDFKQESSFCNITERKKLRYHSSYVHITDKDVAHPNIKPKFSLSRVTLRKNNCFFLKDYTIKEDNETIKEDEETIKENDETIKEDDKTIADIDIADAFCWLFLERDPVEKRVLDLCGQTELLPFEQLYDDSFVEHCVKIGEGTYGEVFCYKNNSCLNSLYVFKIMPVLGVLRYESILPELEISINLSRLGDDKEGYFYTNTFCNVRNAAVIKGKYPKMLLDLWNNYANDKGTENTTPAEFDENQIYLSIHMDDGGKPLDDYIFSNACVAYHIILQVIFALSVAEEAFEFEHRDLHGGNILIMDTKQNEIKYRISGTSYSIPSWKKKATIIDFSLSRKRESGSNDPGSVMFANLAEEDLFSQDGDLQYDVYRYMRDDVRNNWKSYVPKTNVRWIHYLADKCCSGDIYTKKNQKQSKNHIKYIWKLRNLRKSVVDFNSASEIALSLQEYKD